MTAAAGMQQGRAHSALQRAYTEVTACICEVTAHITKVCSWGTGADNPVVIRVQVLGFSVVFVTLRDGLIAEA